jgi:hypothetical protein
VPEDGRDQPRGPDKEKEKAHTKPMPHRELKDFDEWVKTQKKPTPDDKGEAPPDPPQDQKEPREHGSAEEEKDGVPT